MTDKSQEADAADTRSATAEEADNDQQRSDADKKRRHPVERLVHGRRRLRRTGSCRQQSAVPQPVSMYVLPHTDPDQQEPGHLSAEVIRKVTLPKFQGHPSQQRSMA